MVAIHSGMAADWVGVVSSHAKPVEVYSQKVMSGSQAKAGNSLSSHQVPREQRPEFPMAFQGTLSFGSRKFIGQYM
ncbi:hypothetical protein TNCV_2401861 [Trichonephila clavipes]|nr:hypothetical protein TNCV_2401861 [Trichonephila clavipes]